MALKMHASLAGHVGDWLKSEIVEPHGINVAALARHFGVSRQALSTLLNGHASLSADMAIRFEKAFGVKADTLMGMQTTYELAQVRAREGEIAVTQLGLAGLKAVIDLGMADVAAGRVKDFDPDHIPNRA
jgi:addiction module HigA family antidote